MNKYEMMYIIDAALEDAPRKELIEKVSAQIAANGGVVEKVDEWGKRRLAYAINYKTEGYYVLVNFSAESEVPHEMERLLQINEQVLRYLVIRLEEKHTSVKPRAIPVRPAAPVAEEAPAAEEAPVAAEAPATEA
ncbi:MAG: 30S ribosomal protein S6 [Clostridiales bacterium]|nr:30S ribosomal protein S6 [Clostridiales bacterium]